MRNVVTTRQGLWASFVLSLGLFAGACDSGATAGDGAAAAATLKVLGALTPEGVEYSPSDSVVELTCDRRLTVRFGPRDDAGLLVDWILRPPLACGDTAGCGYLHVTVEGAAGAVLLEEESALPDALLDFSAQDLTAVTAIVGELREGQSGEPYLVDDKPVRARWELQVEAGSCDAGEGGAGGAGGAP